MTQRKKFKYVGLNGTIFSPVLLPEIDKTEFIELRADEGKILTDGVIQKKVALIFSEDLDKWTEIEEDLN